MIKQFIILLLFCACNLFALTIDDFIVQETVPSFDGLRQRIYLGQIWGETERDRVRSNLLNTETHEQWLYYADVVIYNYESLQINTTSYGGLHQYRVVIFIRIVDDRYSTRNGIIVGNSINDVIAYYGEPFDEILRQGQIITSYRIDDPREGWSDTFVTINFFHRNNIITMITLNYDYFM
jgi:hypothetical protein